MAGNLKVNRKLVWLGRGISTLVILPFVMSAFMKFRPDAQVIQGLSHLSISPSLLMPLAILEIVCVLLYAIPKTSVLGAILLTGYLGGAICTHLRVGDDFIIQTALGVLIWLGLYLREIRLRKLLPLRA